GNKSQNARVKALDDFKCGRIRALVATEVASRGLDIKELPQVVNYELPNVPEDYVHRIGRTARAGASGCAVSLVSPDETSLLRDIERSMRQKVPFMTPPRFEIGPSEIPESTGAQATQPRRPQPQTAQTPPAQKKASTRRRRRSRAGSGRARSEQR
ncbi:MAG: hypothetical protein KDK91_15860, partial [Gammaproteobacteria bacterium]|nr:hypothetical protein [Gammaproteobacteria bacterium]